MVRVRSAATLFLVLVLVTLLASAGAGGSTATAAPLANPFGPNVLIFDPSMPVGDIQAAVDAVYAQQVSAEMGTSRYALLFKPGVYGSANQPLQLRSATTRSSPAWAPRRPTSRSTARSRSTTAASGPEARATATRS